MITKEMKMIGFTCKNRGKGCNICTDKYLCADTTVEIPNIEYIEEELECRRVYKRQTIDCFPEKDREYLSKVLAED